MKMALRTRVTHLRKEEWFVGWGLSLSVSVDCEDGRNLGDASWRGLASLAGPNSGAGVEFRGIAVAISSPQAESSMGWRDRPAEIQISGAESTKDFWKSQ
jgi:hypothetical protein